MFDIIIVTIVSQSWTSNALFNDWTSYVTGEHIKADITSLVAPLNSVSNTVVKSCWQRKQFCTLGNNRIDKLLFPLFLQVLRVWSDNFWGYNLKPSSVSFAATGTTVSTMTIGNCSSCIVNDVYAKNV